MQDITTIKRGRGRPSFEPTEQERKYVEALSGYGVPHHQIAKLIREGIATETLLLYFRAELDRGKAMASAKVTQTLFKKATDGDVTALIWWTKIQLGWKECREISGVNGNPIELSVANRKLTDSELMAEIEKRGLPRLFDDTEQDNEPDDAA